MPGAAVVRARAPLARRGLGRAQIHEIQVPFAGDSVAVLVRLRKVVYRVEKQDGDVWPQLPKDVHEHDTLRLKARGHARPLGCCQLVHDERVGRRHRSSSANAARTASIAASSLDAPRANAASRSAASRRAGEARYAFAPRVTMPAPAVKLESGSMSRKLPGARLSA